MRAFFIFLLTISSIYALTLEEAIDRAMKNSPLIHKAKSNVAYAQTDELGAESGFHPKVNAGFNWQDTDAVTAFSFTPSYNYNLSAKYNLFNGFSDLANMNSKEFQTQAQKLLLSAKKSDIKLEVIRAYTDCLKAKKYLKTQEDELRSLEHSYKDSSTRYEQGMIAKNELLLIDVERLKSEQSLNIAKSSIKRSRNTLRRLLGGALESTEQIEDIKVSAFALENFDILLKSTYEKRSELHALYKQRESLKSQQQITTSAFYPKADVSADYILNDKERYAGEILVQVQSQLQTKVNVTWNLYNGRSDEANRRGIIENISAINADIDSMKLDLEYQLSDAFETYHVAQSQLEVSKRTLQSAQENYRITKDKYDYGEIDSLNLLTAQANLTTAQNDHNNANYEILVAFATIKRISGNSDYD